MPRPYRTTEPEDSPLVVVLLLVLVAQLPNQDHPYSAVHEFVMLKEYPFLKAVLSGRLNISSDLLGQHLSAVSLVLISPDPFY